MKQTPPAPTRDLTLIELDLFCESARDAISGLNGYRKILEDLLISAEDSDFSALKTRLTAAPESMHARILEADYPYWWQQLFIPQFRASFFVWAVSVIEYHLAWAEKLANALSTAPRTDRATRDRSIAKGFQAFFSQLSDFGQAPDNMWLRLADAYKLRNALGHAAATMHLQPDERRRALQNAIKTFGALTYELFVELAPEHCEAVESLAGTVCHYLIAGLNRSARRS